MSVYSAAWIHRMSSTAPMVVSRMGREVCQYITPAVQKEIDEWNSVPRTQGAPAPITVRDLTEEEREQWAPLIEPFFANKENRPFAENGGIPYGLVAGGYVVRLAEQISQSSLNTKGPLGNDVRDPKSLLDSKTVEGSIKGQFWLEPGQAAAVASVEILCVPGYVVMQAKLFPRYNLLGLRFNAFDPPRGIRAPLSGIISNPTDVPIVIHASEGFAEVQFSLLIQD